MRTRLHLIVNPASGQRRPPLETLAGLLRGTDVAWDVSITKRPGDAIRLAHEAATHGADVVAAYGGDGTVAEVASGLLGTGKRLAVLPGGTANVLRSELGLPSSLKAACLLACGHESATASLDVIGVRDGAERAVRHVLLQAGVGLHARVVEGAERERKKRLGWYAYALSATRQIMQPRTHRFRLTLDGREIEEEGVACLLCNSGRMGSGMLRLAPKICSGDGLLDVLVFRRADASTALALLRSTLAHRTIESDLIGHWQARTVRVETAEPQPVQGDGNIVAQTPVTARILPGALSVLVPEAAAILTPPDDGERRSWKSAA